MSVSDNIDSVIRELNSTFEKLDADVGKIINSTANYIKDETEKGADRHTVTGALHNSVFLKSVNNGYLVGIDENKAPHAIFVHFPVRPHLTKPKNKKALRWSSNGLFHFSKKGIHHPGYKGDPFFYDAIKNGMRFLDQQANKLKLR